MPVDGLGFFLLFFFVWSVAVAAAVQAGVCTKKKNIHARAHTRTHHTRTLTHTQPVMRQFWLAGLSPSLVRLSG